MRNLQTLITDMKSTQIISRSAAQHANDPTLRELASTYSDIIQEWILRLEEAERLINLQIYSAKINAQIDELEIQFPAHNSGPWS